MVGVSKEWQDAQDVACLRELSDLIYMVEEVPMDRIQELCDRFAIRSYKFHSAWLGLLDASHSLMDKVDDLHGRYNGVD